MIQFAPLFIIYWLFTQVEKDIQRLRKWANTNEDPPNADPPNADPPNEDPPNEVDGNEKEVNKMSWWQSYKRNLV